MPALSTPPPPSATQGGPGPQGPPGQGAFSFTTTDIPAYDGVSNLTVQLDDTSWVPLDGPVFIAGVGSFSVSAINQTTQTLTLVPLKTDIGTPPYHILVDTMVAASGFPGLNGATGNTGPQGVPGIQGPPGPQGLQGPQGQAGVAGATGPQGPNGQQGVAGPPGQTGATGGTGPQGPIGVKGDSGPQGIQGIQGVNGPQGPGGPIGATGPQGPQGPPGPAVTAQGNWNPASVYAQGDLVTWNNLIYIGLRASQNAQPDTHPQDWAVYSSIGIQGPSGATGPMGPPGATGPQGVPGPQGVTGADGATGATGPVGATGPQGSPGPTGAEGPTGATGPMGPAGPQGVPGTGAVWRGNWNSGATYNPNDAVSYNGSSYVAVGTNSNSPPDTNPSLWQLIAQKGDQGVVGPQGPIGPIGPTGPTGATGSQGVQGPAGATGPPGPTAVSGDAGNTAMLGSDSRIYVPPIQLATTTKIGALQKLSGNTTDILNGTNTFGPVPLATNANQGGIIALSNKTTDFLDGTNHFQDLPTAIQPTIWSARLRSFNAIGNPNFEVDQRNIGNAVAVVPGTPGWIDRWTYYVAGTMRASSQQIPANVALPGTSFFITQKIFRLTLTTAQAALGANDQLNMWQGLEGPQLRELLGDVHSVSILARSTVANLKFGLLLTDAGATATRALGKLCSLGAANTWNLITLPNLPIWDAAGVFPVTPGSLGYYTVISLASGASRLIPADTWQSGGNVSTVGGVVGQSNFAANPVNSTFDIAFVQHEPGPLCTTLIDQPFTQNYDECLRYYQKTFPYGTAAGTVSSAGYLLFYSVSVSTSNMYMPIPFKKTMAKAPPNLIAYSSATGAANTVRNISTSADVAVSTPAGVGDSGFAGVVLSAAVAADSAIAYNYTADTGW